MVLGYNLGSAVDTLWGRGNVGKLLFITETGVEVVYNMMADLGLRT